MSRDDRLRDLERRVTLDPSDEEARLSLTVERLRGGERDHARATIAPSSAEGYRLLCSRAPGEPLLLPLLDLAPEWRSSGGDSGCSRWSKAEAVSSPRTAWRRRIEEIHAALAVAVDRGRAFVVTLGPRGTELVALDVFTGVTLWRFALGHGAPAAPLAREGWVFVASVEGGLLKTVALSSDGAVIWRADDACDENCLPGALNVYLGELVLPIGTTWRGSSRVGEWPPRAFLVSRDSTSGRTLWREPAEQVFAESIVVGLPVAQEVRDHLFFVCDFVTGTGRWVVRGSGQTQPLGQLGAPPQFLASRGEEMAHAEGGVLTTGEGDWSSTGGMITSLAFDGQRLVVGRGAEFAVKDSANGSTLATWQTHESPLPFRPRGVAHPPPAPRSAVCAEDTCYLASPLSPSLSAFSVKTGACLWRHEVEGLLVPEDGPRLTWPTSEAGPPDRGPLHLAPLPGRVLGVTLSGYVFLIDGRSP